MQLQTIFKAGNSRVVAIPSNLGDDLGFLVGKKVNVTKSPDKKIIISLAGENTKTSSLTPEFLEWMDDFNKQYGPALKKLANK